MMPSMPLFNGALILLMAIISVVVAAHGQDTSATTDPNPATATKVRWNAFPGAATATTSGAPLVSFNLDWHPGREGPTWGANASIVTIPLDNPRLRRLARAMAPAYLRVGGSEGDVAVYDIPPGTCAKSGVDPAFCLTAERWTEVTEFAAATGLKVAFGLNIMYGRGKDHKGAWDPSNAVALLEYTAAHNLTVGGFEMGNEKENELPPGPYGRVVAAMRRTVDRLWPRPAARPLLIGPDENPRPDWLRTYLESGGNASDVVTYHLYPGYGLDPSLKEEIVDPAWLDFTRVVAGEIQRVQLAAAPSAQLWVGETAASWHSGEDGITNAFESGFWFVDQLATLATMGHKVMCRQCFVGGNYTMVGVNDGFVPRPDYWTGLLFKRLMGARVLATTQSEPATTPYYTALRGYMHCTPPRTTAPAFGAGAVTFAFLNTDATETFEVQMTGSNPDGSKFDASGKRVEYVLTSDALDSAEIFLNGNKLALDPATDGVPDVVALGRAVPLGNLAGALSVPPRSYGFVVWPGANAQACKN